MPCLREELVQRLLDEIKQFDPTKHPSNSLLYGCFASGKTSAIKRLIQRVNSETSVKVVYANCWKYYTRMAVYALIARALGMAIPRRGLATDEVFDQISQNLELTRQRILVILDRADGLVFNHEQQLLYDLVSLSRQKRYLSLITICDDERGFIELDERIRTCLYLKEILVPPFTKDELLQIIRVKASAGLAPGSYTDEVLETCAEITLRARNNIRVGLELFWKAALIVQTNGRTQITPEDLLAVEKGTQSIVNEKAVNWALRLAGLSLEEKLLVSILSRGAVSSTRLYAEFRKNIFRTKRQIRNYLKRLAARRIIASSIQASSKHFFKSRVFMLNESAWA